MPSTNQRPILVSAIEALAEELPSGKRRGEMRQLASSLRDNKPISDSASDQRSQCWLPIFAYSLATPAAASRLSEWMNQAARENEIRSRRRRVVLYPIVVFAFAALVFFGLSQMVVSPFIEMYDDFGLNLPAPTEFLFFWVNQWQDHTIRFVIIAASIGLIGYMLARFWIEHAFSTRLFGYFAGGTTANVAAMASFTGLLADLVANDVPLDASLELAGQSCGHQHFANVAMSLADQHRRYNVLLAQSQLAKCFPKNVVDALQPIDGSPPQARLLRELSTIYAERAAQRTEWATGLVGAVAVFLVGLVVAFVVISLFMPLVSLISVLA